MMLVAAKSEHDPCIATVERPARSAWGSEAAEEKAMGGAFEIGLFERKKMFTFSLFYFFIFLSDRKITSGHESLQPQPSLFLSLSLSLSTIGKKFQYF